MRCGPIAATRELIQAPDQADRASMKRFGFTNPILVSDDMRSSRPWSVRAAKLLAWRRAGVRLSHLAMTTAAYVLADNRWPRRLAGPRNSRHRTARADRAEFRHRSHRFAMPEIDLILDEAASRRTCCPEDMHPEMSLVRP